MTTTNGVSASSKIDDNAFHNVSKNKRFKKVAYANLYITPPFCGFVISPKRVKEELDHCQRPIYFFDDDVDGLASFLLLYRYKREGKGFPVKVAGGIREDFIPKTQEYDKVFILDIPEVSQSFLDGVGKTTVWVDHHPTHKRKNALIYNPLLENPKAIRPTSLLCYDVVQQDVWVAAAGMVGDWVLDKKLVAKLAKEYPDLLSEKITDPGEALFNSQIGELSKMMNFFLKGSIRDIKKSIAMLTRIESPYELLKQTSESGKRLHKQYLNLNEEYVKLLAQAKKEVKKDHVAFSYKGNLSFTSELSNELLFLHPEKYIIVAREKSGEMRASLRGNNIRDALEKALQEVSGRGGGHPHACGVSIKKEEWKKFLQALCEGKQEG
tara:strand:- start:724 stop:1866 length:1143 start_codon:yes stop_codon:yes gene_type:complete